MNIEGSQEVERNSLKVYRNPDSYIYFESPNISLFVKRVQSYLETKGFSPKVVIRNENPFNNYFKINSCFHNLNDTNSNWKVLFGSGTTTGLKINGIPDISPEELGQLYIDGKVINNECYESHKIN